MLKIIYAGCLVYRKAFRRNLFLKCMLQPEIAKKSLKTPTLGGCSRSFEVADLDVNGKTYGTSY